MLAGRFHRRRNPLQPADAVPRLKVLVAIFEIHVKRSEPEVKETIVGSIGGRCEKALRKAREHVT